MKFEDLYKKIRAIDEGTEVAPIEAEGIEIIGGPMGGMLGGMGHSEPPKQQDSVSMNVSLNGAGAGGVRDLMDILHRIDAGGDRNDNHDEPAHHEPDHEEPIMGDMIKAMASEEMEENHVDFDEQEVENLLKRFDENMNEIGGYGDPDYGKIFHALRNGDVKSAVEEVWDSYSDQDGGEIDMDAHIEDLEANLNHIIHGSVDENGEQPAQDVGMEEEMGDDGETWANSAHGDAGAHTHGVDAVTSTGDDMNSKGGFSPLARAPGSNSLIRHHWHVQEGLVDKLAAMYEEIKGEPMVEDSHQAKTTMKHVNASDASDKTKAAIKKASKDIKLGTKGYKDREDALTAAGVEDDRGPREKIDESVSQMLALNKRLNG